MQKILIVEDDKRLADAMSQILTSQDYDVESYTNGNDGFDAAMNNAYDVIMLDVMLPGKDGIAICHDLRDSGVNTPIIMVTARSEVTDKIAGLDSGADDYLPKPFHPRELVARINALTRRMSAYGYDGHVRYGNVEFDSETGELTHGDDTVVLTGKEYEIMKVLMSEPGGVFSKDTIISKVWGDGAEVDANNVEAYISFLRKKLAFINGNVVIRTLRKVGYRLEVE